MGLIKKIDQGIRKVVFSIFWWFLDPLEPERLYGELVDVMDRNLDASNPHRLLAPDSFDVSVNNTVFIKHAHSIKTLETSIQDRLQKYTAEKDYELLEPLIKLHIISSATISKHKVEIRHRFSAQESDQKRLGDKKNYQLKVIQGQGKGSTWKLESGNTYSIGRVSTADICLPYEIISKKHATLYFMSEAKLSIVDEGSANGTFINDEEEPIKGSRELSIGNKIRFCKLDPIILTLSAE